MDRSPLTSRMVGDGHDRSGVKPGIRVAALMYVVMGVGFGIGTAITLDHYVKNGELPMTPFGFRSLSGPFESLAPAQFVALGWLFVGVCALDVLTGAWLWRGRRRGAVLGLATSPVAFALGIGFALPIVLIGVPIRAALLWMQRGALR